MESGETAGQGNGHPTRRPHGKRSAQARSWKPGRRRQPSGARERWKPVRGETPQAARCATRTTTRPAMLLGRGRTAFKARCTSSCASHRERGSTATAVVWPIRRSRFGGIEGRQASRGGDSPQGFPLEASAARNAPSGALRHHAESSGRRLDSATGIQGEVEFR